ncbi:FadR/GntR family transcriptional regulator [Inquilinus sp. CAU 1745]|uniref:FadR/GntR family transcriptional regulator n=1 Tax=Inquilinus sp. CAU 1745 TaxID=3140369 RepID=UPI00325C2283
MTTGRHAEAGEIRLADYACRKLRALIDRHQWEDGGKLPGEIELARDIGVSRPVLRQALAMLREDGLVVSRRGSGNYVTLGQMEENSAYGPLQSLSDIEDCFRFRCVLECEASMLAARAKDGVLIARIEEAAAKILNGGRHGENSFDADFAFHMAVAAASKNCYYGMTLRALRRQIKFGHDLSRQLRNIPGHHSSKRVAREHDRILRAIQSGDPEAAREAMRVHIEAGIDRLFGR